MSPNFPKEEEAILKRWREIGAFQRQNELSLGRPRWTFYDGPPFATGLPHYGHLLAGTIKDCMTRWAVAKGFSVERRFGWDCHGLPIEHEIDKKLGMSGREAVEKIGIQAYNAECRSIVQRYSTDWRETIDRLGRWIDFDNDYKTMDTTFMESVWYVFKQIFDKGAVYKGYRVMPCSTVLQTPLSNFEASSNYADVQDPSVVVTFPLLSDPEQTSLLAWTTTPYTLPSNTALAVHPDLEYINILDEISGKNYILLESGLKLLYKDPKKAKFKIGKKLKGKDMLGWQYKPLYNYFQDQFKDYGFRVLNDTYVSSDAGVGVVHQAQGFGADDYRVGMEAGVISKDRLPPVPINDSGRFTAEVPDYEGQYFKDANKAIIKELKSQGRLIVNGTLTHSVPLCPRSDTPLIYRAVPSWFIKVTDYIPQLLESVAATRWVPSFVKDQRFRIWLENAHDWGVSRSRFWGCPLNLFVSDDGEEVICVGSIQELKDLSGYEGDLSDIHRDKIDHITIPSTKGKGQLRRVPDVFDCWFESGSMPYASSHYPFENTGHFEAGFPGDFIAEGLDQTRGWFYSLTVIGTILFGKSPFKNCIVNGTVLAEDGKKMSKRLKNYPDPKLVMDRYSCDSLRLYLINSPVVRAEPLKFKESGVKDMISQVLLPMWNSYRFFEDQVLLVKKTENVDFVWDPEAEKESSNVMDRWILAKIQSLLRFVNDELSAYRLYTVVPRLLELLDSTTNWYIRFNRRRLKGEFGVTETVLALNTLFEVLFTLCKGLAPFMPFLTDNIYQRLLPYIPTALQGEDSRSVHFLPFPEVHEELFDTTIERQVKRMQTCIDLGRVSRERKTVALKQPLKCMTVIHSDEEYLSDLRLLQQYICDELNILDLILSSDEEKYNVQYSVSADWPVLGKKFKKDAQKLKKALPTLSSDAVREFTNTKTLNVEGIVLGEDDLIMKRGLKEDDASKNIETNTDNDVLTLLDVTIDPDLAKAGIAREIMNRVQKLRKKANLVPTDDVKMEYKVLSDPEHIGIDDVFENHGHVFGRAVRGAIGKHTEVGGGIPDKKEDVVIAEEQEVQKATFLLRLVKL